MPESRNTSGFLAFTVMFLLFLAASLSLQRTVVEGSIDVVFPNYEFLTGVLPGEWIIMSRDLGTDDGLAQRKEALRDITGAIRSGEYGQGDATLNTLRGKKKLKEFGEHNSRTVYFVNPYIAFMPLHLFIAGILAFLVSMFLPVQGSIAWTRRKLHREYERVGSLLRKQFEAHGVDFDEMFRLSSTKREELLRFTTLPQVIVTEIEDYAAIDRWMRNESANPLVPLKFYFRYRISAAYGNIIQGLVSGGAAILIFVIGLRGLKLIPAEEPSLILMALSVEFILLIVLMVTFAGSAQEERLDRVVKELEAEQRDAIKQQTDTLHEVMESTRGGGTGGGGSVDSIADYEERRLLDEVLSMMLREAERKRGTQHGR